MSQTASRTGRFAARCRAVAGQAQAAVTRLIRKGGPWKWGENLSRSCQPCPFPGDQLPNRYPPLRAHTSSPPGAGPVRETTRGSARPLASGERGFPSPFAVSCSLETRPRIPQAAGAAFTTHRLRPLLQQADHHGLDIPQVDQSRTVSHQSEPHGHRLFDRRQRLSRGSRQPGPHLLVGLDSRNRIAQRFAWRKIAGCGLRHDAGPRRGRRCFILTDDLKGS